MVKCCLDYNNPIFKNNDNFFNKNKTKGCGIKMEGKLSEMCRLIEKDNEELIGLNLRLQNKLCEMKDCLTKEEIRKKELREENEGLVKTIDGLSDKYNRLLNEWDKEGGLNSKYKELKIAYKNLVEETNRFKEESVDKEELKHLQECLTMEKWYTKELKKDIEKLREEKRELNRINWEMRTVTEDDEWDVEEEMKKEIIKLKEEREREVDLLKSEDYKKAIKCAIEVLRNTLNQK